VAQDTAGCMAFAMCGSGSSWCEESPIGFLKQFFTKNRVTRATPTVVWFLIMTHTISGKSGHAIPFTDPGYTGYQGCWLVLSPTRKETSYSDRRF